MDTLGNTLLGAAMIGLLGTGCEPDPSCESQGGSGGGEEGGHHSGVGGAGYEVLSDVEDPSMTFAKFQSLCNGRAGFLQTHATCSGNNSCRGLSFNKFDYHLIEHTCRAMNTCGGISCVDPAADEMRAPAEAYLLHCSGCHGDPMDGFTLFVPKGSDLTQAVAGVVQKPREAVVSAVAFGLVGRNSNGTAAANMPGFFTRYSRAEIEALVDYSLDLPITAVEYGVLGVDEDVVPPTP